jgi:putative flippase GtrA
MVATDKKEVVKFIVTGCLAVTTDLISYYLLIDHISIDPAKAISFILGSIIAFILNKLWTFQSKTQLSIAAFQFSILYGLTFMANVSVNHIAIIYMETITQVAFLLATATSTILNFIGMKFWVFSHKHAVSS